MAVCLSGCTTVNNIAFMPDSEYDRCFMSTTKIDLFGWAVHAEKDFSCEDAPYALGVTERLGVVDDDKHSGKD
jgi:hypothetical protein